MRASKSLCSLHWPLHPSLFFLSFYPPTKVFNVVVVVVVVFHSFIRSGVVVERARGVKFYSEANIDAAKQFREDFPGFRKRVAGCVRKSQAG